MCIIWIILTIDIPISEKQSTYIQLLVEIMLWMILGGMYFYPLSPRKALHEIYKYIIYRYQI